jgi:TonB family protein
MEAFALYLLKSSAWLTGFAVIYFLFLRNERFFLLKRAYLITGIIISFVFPLISFHYQVEVPVPDIQNSGISEAGNPMISGEQQDNPEKTFDSGIILLSLYLAGVAFLVLRALFHIRRIFKAISGTKINNRGEARLVRATQFPASFSFFNYVFINPEVNENEAEEIINHELVHVSQKHWLDLLLVEIMRVVQWINPFAWIYSGFIKLNHEYLADRIAIQKSVNPAIYQAALVNQIMGAPVLSLSNAFNYSLNKKRFDMMKNIISSPYRKMKVLFVLPVFALVFYAFAEPEYHYSSQAPAELSISEPPAIIVMEVKGVVVKEDGTPFAGVQILIAGTKKRTTTDASGNFTLSEVPEPAFIVFSYRGYLTQIIKAGFKAPMSVKLLKDPEYIEEVFVVSYGDSKTPVSQIIKPETETITDNVLIVIDGEIKDKEALKNMDVNTISSMNVLKGKQATDKYGEKGKDGVVEVATQKGQPIVLVDGVIIARPLNEVTKEIGPEVGTLLRLTPEEAIKEYGDNGKNGAIVIMTRKRAAELGIKLPFRRVNPDDYPTFQGNPRHTFQEWVINHVKYPPEATTRGVSGLVRADYTIEADGKVSSVKSTSAVDPLLVDALVAAIQSSPAWEPSKNPEANEPWKSSLRVKFELPDKVVIPEPEPFVVVEQMPRFREGDEALLNYISENTQYPDSAKTGGIMGRVIVRFVVNAQGLVEDVSVLKGVHPLLDAEAVRVVRGLPAFTPGYQGGKPVPVYYMVPITFTVK